MVLCEQNSPGFCLSTTGINPSVSLFRNIARMHFANYLNNWQNQIKQMDNLPKILKNVFIILLT